MRAQQIVVRAVMALALAGCGKSQTVEKPVAQVLYDAVEPARRRGRDVAGDHHARAPVTGSSRRPNKVVWHFMRQSGEYGRYVAELSEAGANKTTVTTHFEDGPADPNLRFLDDIATIAGDASVAAALEGHAVDRSGVQAKIRERIASDPVASQAKSWNMSPTRWTEWPRPTRCKTGTPKEMNSWVCQKQYEREAARRPLIAEGLGQPLVAFIFGSPWRDEVDCRPRRMPGPLQCGPAR